MADATADASSPSRSSGYGMHIAAASAKQVVRGRRWLRALQGAVDSTTQSVGSQGAKMIAKGSEALAVVDQRLGLSEAASAAEQRMQLSEKAAQLSQKVQAADLRLQISAKAQELSQDWQAFRDKADTQQGKLLSQLNKAVVKAATSLSSLNSRRLAQALDPKALCFYDAGEFPGCSGLVALTIDDAPCRGQTSMLGEMKELLTKFDARATFFLCTDNVPGHEDALVDLIQAGSEVANHGCSDRPLGGLSESEFNAVFRRAENVCEALRAQARGEVPQTEAVPVELTAPAPDPTAAEAAAASAASPRSPAEVEGDVATPKRNWAALGFSGLASGLVPKVEAPEAPAVVPQSPYRWFRAPHADLSPNMQKVLSENGFTNVLCDSFANDTQILDSNFIAETLLSLVDPRGGSIIVIHTPERGFREHNFDALEILLKGLAERQLRAVTVTELTNAALREQRARTPAIATEVAASGSVSDAETDQH